MYSFQNRHHIRGCDDGCAWSHGDVAMACNDHTRRFDDTYGLESISRYVSTKTF